MKKAFLTMVCLFVVIALISCSGSAPKQLTDREILVKIYETMNGPNWKVTDGENWNSDKPIEEWKGVKVNDEGRVIGLTVKGDSLRGLIPAEIGGLTELEDLHIFSRNFDIANVIPAEIGKLTKLKSIAIYSYSGPKGEGPVLANLMTLVNLERAIFSAFSGPIPENIGQLNKLRYLSISGFEGKIPESICELTDLTQLFLETSKQPEGAVPDCIGRLSKLETIKIDYSNVMSGGIKPPNAKFPESIWDLTNLENLIVRNISNTGGPIPGEKVAKMNKLRTVSIVDCGITGPIPAEFFESGKLVDLSMNRNKLTGSIPAEIGNCPKLSYINLYKNQLTGNIPKEVTNCAEIHRFDLSDNQLTGNIPDGFGKYKNFYSFNLSGNQLSSNIPADLKAHPDFSKFKF